MCWIFWRRNFHYSFVGGGDYPEVDKVEIGLLGADLAIENGKYH
jgi:hypothetical protein